MIQSVTVLLINPSILLSLRITILQLRARLKSAEKTFVNGPIIFVCNYVQLVFALYSNCFALWKILLGKLCLVSKETREIMVWK